MPAIQPAADFDSRVEAFFATWDPAISAPQRTEELCRLLVEEVKTPIPPWRNDVGHVFDHEYLLHEMILHLLHAVEDSPPAQALLRQKIQTETLADAKQVMQIALGLAGDKSVWRDLAAILRQARYVSLRNEAALALHETRGVLAIPNLLEALSGPSGHCAAHSLERMGVKIAVHTVNGQKHYGADRPSAIKVLCHELSRTDQEAVSGAIEAIAGIGGEEAKAVLRRFIDENEAKPGRSSLVSRATDALMLTK